MCTILHLIELKTLIVLSSFETVYCCVFSLLSRHGPITLFSGRNFRIIYSNMDTEIHLFASRFRYSVYGIVVEGSRLDSWHKGEKLDFSQPRRLLRDLNAVPQKTRDSHFTKIQKSLNIGIFFPV